MGSGNKGSSQETTINRDLAEASKPLIERASVLGELPYTPNRGIQFAAFSPLQQAAFQSTNDAANAFGLSSVGDPMAGMPAPTMGDAGILGYGSGQVYDDNINASMPQSLQDYYNSFFRDPNQAYTQVAQPNPVSGAGGILEAVRRYSDASEGR